MTDRDMENNMRTGKEDTIREKTETAADHRVDPVAEADHPKSHNADSEGAPHHCMSTPLHYISYFSRPVLSNIV